jgi:exodeoxyribonuclease VII small subunit
VDTNSMAKKKTDVDPAAPSFEESLAELEQIVAKLEGGKLGLSDSLTAYEHGVKRLNHCYQLLRHAERRIELVKSVDAEGAAQTTPLEDSDDEDLMAKSAARSRRRSAVPPSEPKNGCVDDDGGLF